MILQNNRPLVGVGVILFNEYDEILLGERKNSHGSGTFAPPGGHLEYGESFEKCASRELKEETNLTITNFTFLDITNNIFEENNKHYVTIFMQNHISKNAVITNMEPDKTSAWLWFNINNLPNNLFLPLKSLLIHNPDILQNAHKL